MRRSRPRGAMLHKAVQLWRVGKPCKCVNNCCVKNFFTTLAFCRCFACSARVRRRLRARLLCGSQQKEGGEYFVFLLICRGLVQWIELIVGESICRSIINKWPFSNALDRHVGNWLVCVYVGIVLYTAASIQTMSKFLL